MHDCGVISQEIFFKKETFVPVAKIKNSKKQIYVALLRGINVGGNSKISMKDLAACFEKLGFVDVKTYINSGNVIFNPNGKAEAKLVEVIEQGIKKYIGLDIRVVVRSLKQIAVLCKKIPQAWTNDASSRTDILFLWKEIDRPRVLAEVVINPAVDHLLYVKGAIVWHFDRKDFNKSKMHKFIGTFVYKNMTARNINTTRKLYMLMSEKMADTAVKKRSKRVIVLG